MFGLGPQEFFFVILLGVLLFGKRLPDVGRSIGKTVMEFKNGLRGLEDELSATGDRADRWSAAPPPRPPQRLAPTAPKFVEPEEPV